MFCKSLFLLLQFTDSDYPPPPTFGNFFHSGITSNNSTQNVRKNKSQSIHHSNGYIFETSNKRNLKKTSLLN